MQNYRKTSHVIYDIKYHICWITKYRKEVLKGEIAERVRDLTRQICSSLEVQIITGAVSRDHVHLLVSVPPQLSVSKLVQRVKGATSRKIQQEYRRIRKEYWGQHIWGRGYFVVTTGNVTDDMWREYISKQGKVETTIDDFRIEEI